ncbi:MAG: hypothetical protein OJF49_002549 [Ktedonobacterales bacterium]|jgi:hypothetical protein|nr:MAG: hypothetical protein OJF49_002549 [Ktedonobacterales bacterium]
MTSTHNTHHKNFPFIALRKGQPAETTTNSPTEAATEAATDAPDDDAPTPATPERAAPVFDRFPEPPHSAVLLPSVEIDEDEEEPGEPEDETTGETTDETTSASDGGNGDDALAEPPGAAALAEPSGAGTLAAEDAEAKPPVSIPNADAGVGGSMRIVRHAFGWRYALVLAFSLAALLVSLLNFALFVGAVTIPISGLRPPGQTAARDTATYNFEQDADGWMARGAAANAVSNNLRVFAGQGALEVQATQITQARQAFVYIANPAEVKPGSTITAHIYIPTGAQEVVAALYTLDGAWLWHNSPFPALTPGQWTAIVFHLPPTLPTPIRELGIMFVSAQGALPYTGPIFIDSVNVRSG